MKSVELQISELSEVAKKHGKGSELVLLQEVKPLERRLHELTKLCQPYLESFSESAGKNELVESFKANFGMSEAQARIAAGVDRSNKNGSGGWIY